MAYSGSEVTVLRPYGVMGRPWASFAGKTEAIAAVITDARTVMGRIIVAFTSGDQFRLRAVRTEGGSDLQTIANGSAIQAVVYRA